MSGEEQARFFGKFARLVETGIPLLRAFEVAADRVGDEGLKAALNRALRRAYEGNSLSDAFAAEGALFAPEVLCLIAEGEKLGDIERKAAAVSEGLRRGDFSTGAAAPGADEGAGGLEALLATAADLRATAVHIEPGGVTLRRPDGILVPVSGDPGPLLESARRRGARFRAAGLRVRAAHFTSPEGPAAALRLRPERGCSLAEAGLTEQETAEAAAWVAGGPGLVLVAGPLLFGTEEVLEGFVALVDTGSRRVVSAGPADLPGVRLAREDADLYALDADVVVPAPVLDGDGMCRALRATLDGSLVLAAVDAAGPDAAEAAARAASPEGTAMGLRGVVACTGIRPRRYAVRSVRSAVA